MIDIAKTEALATLSDQVDTKAAGGAGISSGGALLVEALRSTELDSAAMVKAGGFGADTTTKAQGTITTGTTNPRIGISDIAGTPGQSVGGLTVSLTNSPAR